MVTLAGVQASVRVRPFKTGDATDVILTLPNTLVAPSDDLQHEVKRLFAGECTLRTTV